MTLREKYSSLDMVRMAKFAKENPELKPIPLIKAYNEKYPEVTDEQKMKNIRNWLDNDKLMQKIESDSNCKKQFCSCEIPKGNYPEMVWCDNCGKYLRDYC